MKNYIKPTINLVAAVADTGTSSSCSTTAEDMDLIQSIVGGADASKIFGSGEPCEISVDLDMYCKFTSTELGAAKIFIS